MPIHSCPLILNFRFLTISALDAIEAEGLQAPSEQRLAVILGSALQAMCSWRTQRSFLSVSQTYASSLRISLFGV